MTSAEFEFEVVCRDASQAQIIVKEFGRPVTPAGIDRVSASEPGMELGMIELSHIVTIVLSFASGVASKVLASWIYDRLTASGSKGMVIRYAGVEITVGELDDIKLLIEGDRYQKLAIEAARTKDAQCG